ncbi:MAG: BamA/TamA family outer membrane protein, partial [Rubrivivax sp.]
ERLLNAAPAQARALLQTEGYFTPEIKVERQDGEPPQVLITVDPGPVTVVGSVDLEVNGPLKASAEAGDARAERVLSDVRLKWRLNRGAPFKASAWSSAKSGVTARLRADAYVLADWERTQARVDASTQSAALAGTIASGPLFLVGPLQIEGLNRQDEQTVRNIANFDLGAPATETLLLDFQERLQKSGLFTSAVVTLKAEEADPLATPVSVRVAEQKVQEATIGIGYSANLGLRTTLEHVHTRPFGYALIARNKFEIAQVEQSWAGELSTQTLPGLYRNLIGWGFSRKESNTDVVTEALVKVGRQQETKRISRFGFVQAERSVTTSTLGRQTSDAVSGHYHGTWRNVDDQLLPTDGRVWRAQLGGGLATSDPGGKGPFVRAYARLDQFIPFARNWFFQGRVELGQVFVRDEVIVPESMRWRAGGDDSVRGYGYRKLTPQINGVDTGGRVLLTASAEVAHPILASIPELWGAVFIDAGRSADNWGDYKPAFGVGLGVRFRSPVGPLKLDLAYGEETQQFRVHLTVGVSF